MLTRRSLRIKVLQAIYACQQNSSMSEQGIQNLFQKSIDNVYRLFLYQVLMLTEIARYVTEDKNKRSRKHLVTDEDKNLSTRLWDNKIIQGIVTDEEFQQRIKAEKLKYLIEPNVVKELYKIFVKTPQYQEYINQEEPKTKGDKQLLKFLFKDIMQASELYGDYLDDHFTNWVDDDEAVESAITSLILNFKAPSNNAPIVALRKVRDWDEKVQFGKELLQHTLKYKEELIALITPQLKNWELERVSQIDVILLQLALSELLYFPTIPVKVSINEYIDISKFYSTPKSKDFINGILDKMMNTLKEEGRIIKLGRGLVGF
ncbi:MAG: transcription antitermination factor NusB [Chitinophagales bacterium]